MEDDTGQGCPPFDASDIQKAKGLWKLKVNRSEAQGWAFRDMQFLMYDDTDDTTLQNARFLSQGDEVMNVDRSSPEDPGSSSRLQPRKSHSTQGFADSVEDTDIQRAILESLKDSDTNSHPPPSEGSTGPKQRQNIATGTRTDEEDIETDEEEIQEAIRLSLMSNEDHDNNSPEAGPGPPSAHDRVHAECETCSGIPVFPHDRKTRRFRLFKPADVFSGPKEPSLVGFCIHYVAVSYCWPEPVRDHHGNIIPPDISSQVRDRDGKKRRARALDYVLDAAVDFANSCGLRMIWIDQECLPQPSLGDKPSEEEIRYKQLGVQAMDFVYNKAVVTLGLHSYKITSQLQADAVRVMIAYAKNQSQPWVPSGKILNSLFEFLRAVQSDRWYTRAWVVQEAISAGGSLFLAFPRGAGTVNGLPAKFRGLAEDRTPRHPLDAGKRELESDLIVIPVQDFQGIVEAAKALLERRFQAVGQVLSFNMDPAFPILSAAELLHPKVTVRQDSRYLSLVGHQVYGSRRKVDAATAIGLLQRRGCRDVQDRITILANMCDYEIRLNTDEVVKCCDSLRLGYLAIALLNGDLSILVPELYELPWDESDIYPAEGRQTGNLLSPFDTDLRLLEHFLLQDGCLFTPRMIRHTFEANQRAGLQLSAYGWTVDSMLDLSILKYQYARQWHSIKCLRIVFDRRKQESQADFESRRQSIAQHFSRGDTMDAAKWELFRHGTIAPDSSTWGALDSDGVRVTAYANAYRVEQNADMQKIVAEIVFAILRYLHGLSTPQSIGAANSIWQSLRVDVVDMPRGSGRRDLPDTVGEELFSHPDVIQAPFHVLQLDKTRDGMYHQAWLIDRVMDQGFLWTASYRRASNMPPLSLPSMVESTEEHQPPLPKKPKTIIERQFSRRMMASLMVSVNHDHPTESTQTHVNIGSMTYLAEMLRWDFLSSDAETAREKDLVAVFDVDGPCTVATPFSPDWEVLPRPSLRSMSICWVIEPLEMLDSTDGEAQATRAEGDSGSASRKGKEPEQPSAMAETRESEMRRGDPETTSSGTEDEDTLFRVVNKVKGMWQIMDPPRQLYSFV